MDGSQGTPLFAHLTSSDDDDEIVVMKARGRKSSFVLNSDSSEDEKAGNGKEKVNTTGSSNQNGECNRSMNNSERKTTTRHSYISGIVID